MIHNLPPGFEDLEIHIQDLLVEIKNAKSELIKVNKELITINSDLLALGIEEGSNANGTWTKFPDGTMICKHTITINAVTTASGNIFRSAPATFWTYPQAFIAAPQVSANDTTSAFTWIGCSSNATDCQAVGWRSASTAGTRATEITAIGRWR